MDGVLNVLKPAGMTSFDVIACLRRIYGQKKIGHGGTLDPLAAGVLPVFLGRAARLIEYAPIHRKTYEAEFLMGLGTDTEDVSGHILHRGPVLADRARWDDIAKQFTGHIRQVPSAFSAKQIGGRRAYDLARAGQEVKLEPKDVTIFDLTIREMKPPYLRLSVTCSSGTYVRALGRDMGQAAGCPLTMEIEADPAGVLMKDLRVLLSALTSVELESGGAADFLQGKRLRTALADAEEAAVYGPQGFLGIAAIRRGVIHPKKVFS